jgi:hypothetical protein
LGAGASGGGSLGAGASGAGSFGADASGRGSFGARAVAEGDEPALDTALAEALARSGARLALPLRLRADAA